MHKMYPTSILLCAVVLSGCDSVKQTITDKPTLSDTQITKLIPKRVNNAKLWATDIGDIFDELSLPKTAQNICTAIAVIDQESNFHADPSVPNLGNAALKAIDDKLEDKLGKNMAGVFRNMLETRPTPKTTSSNKSKL